MAVGQEVQELLDIVNDQDVVIGQCCRSEWRNSEYRANGGLLRFVHIYLTNDKGEVLIQQRSETKSAHPNLLDLSAAGHIQTGDSYESAAYREMQEEIGLTDVTLEPLFKQRVASGFVEVFTAPWNGTPEELTIDPVEVKNVHWMEIDLLHTLHKKAPHLFSTGLNNSWGNFSHYLKTGEKPQEI